MQLTYSSSGRYHNYGNLIKYYAALNPNYILSNAQEVDLSDSNSKSRIKQYIDGSEFMTIKSLFLKINNINIVTLDDYLNHDIPITFPVFLKPSHAYIGGGKGIYYFKSRKELHVFLSKNNLDPNLNYFFDPEIIVNHYPKKWDCRTYGILYISNNRLRLFLGRRGFARFETRDNMTNLSLLENETDESIREYTRELHHRYVEMINDNITTFFTEKFAAFIQQTSNPSFIILGFDSIFTSTKPITPDVWNEKAKSQVNFIEVNMSPVMEYHQRHIEGEITSEIFRILIDEVLFLGSGANRNKRKLSDRALYSLEMVYSNTIKLSSFDYALTQKENRIYYRKFKGLEELKDKREKRASNE